MKNFLQCVTVMLILGYVCGYGQISQDQKAASYLQKKGEVYFTFSIQSRARLDELTKIISIDNVVENKVYAYANERQFQKFTAENIAYEVLTHPGDQLSEPAMTDSSLNGSLGWYGLYPTYETYVTIMEDFARMYPELCRIEEIGTTTEGRKLLFAKISDNVSSEEPEPSFMYTAAMHGDEVGGYVLMLRMIDHLLNEYNSDDRIRNLVDNCQIYINPLANPDGTFAGGNSSVAGATRGNSNNIDLNRNFPNHVLGDHPDGQEWQAETRAMMDFAESKNFVMSANIHGGAEVVNYPWDSWTSENQTTADDDWWQTVAREYADLAQQNSPAGYMTDLNNGITLGGDWYIVYGSRQDYMNWYNRCRELTIELSSVKMVPEEMLLDLWDYNYQSLLRYMERCLQGLTGTVTDAQTGLPVAARIEVVGHDFDNSDIFASAQLGTYFRPIKEGIYTIKVSHDRYPDMIINDVVVGPDSFVVRNINLVSEAASNNIVLSGVLHDPNGNLIGSPNPDTLDVVVRLFNAFSNGTLMYTEEFRSVDQAAIVIDQGEMRIALGSGRSTDNLSDVVGSNNYLWVELTVDGDTLSRVPLTSSPYITLR